MQLVVVPVTFSPDVDLSLDGCQLHLAHTDDWEHEIEAVVSPAMLNNTIVLDPSDTLDGWTVTMRCSNTSLQVFPNEMKLVDSAKVFQDFELTSNNFEAMGPTSSVTYHLVVVLGLFLVVVTQGVGWLLGNSSSSDGKRMGVRLRGIQITTQQMAAAATAVEGELASWLGDAGLTPVIELDVDITAATPESVASSVSDNVKLIHNSDIRCPTDSPRPAVAPCGTIVQSAAGHGSSSSHIISTPEPVLNSTERPSIVEPNDCCDPAERYNTTGAEQVHRSTSPVGIRLRSQLKQPHIQQQQEVEQANNLQPNTPLPIPTATKDDFELAAARLRAMLHRVPTAAAAPSLSTKLPPRQTERLCISGDAQTLVSQDQDTTRQLQPLSSARSQTVPQPLTAQVSPPTSRAAAEQERLFLRSVLARPPSHHSRATAPQA